MKMPILLLTLSTLLAAGSGRASIVIHDGQEGIVATCCDGIALDSFGHAWNLHGSTGWERWPDYDVPLTIDQIKFWNYSRFVTMNDELWLYSGGVFVNFGPWPASGIAGEGPSSAVAPKGLPNPSTGACRLVFQTRADGPVSVHLFDSSGRAVRQLIEATLPSGNYSPVWDGKDDNGQGLAPGVYFAKIQTTEGATTSKVTLTR